MASKVVYVMTRGRVTTTYLVKTDSGKYFSIKTNNRTESLKVDDIISSAERLKPVKDYWIRAYEQSLLYPSEKMKAHLIEYKEAVLKSHQIVKKGDNSYHHILPTPEDNLILGYSYDEALLNTIDLLREKNELRDDFTHLNSSQAFAVNFFAPLIADNKIGLLGENIVSTNDVTCDFEVVEDKQEKTQFDFLGKRSDGTIAFSVEVKYSEACFGPAEENTRHIKKYPLHYEKWMHKLASVEEKEYAFFEYYQIWRNLIYTVRNPGQHICFFFPGFRKDLKEAVEFIQKKSKEEYWPYIHIITADEIVNKIIPLGGNIGQYYMEFKKKYLDID